MKTLRIISILVLGALGVFISAMLFARVIVPEMDWGLYLSEEFLLLAPPNAAIKSLALGIIFLLCSWCLLQSLVQGRPSEQFFALAGEDGDVVFRVRTKALEDYLNQAAVALPHISDAHARITVKDGSTYKVSFRAKAILEGLTLPQIKTSVGEQVRRDLTQMLGLPNPEDIVVDIEAIKPTSAEPPKDETAAYGTF